MTVRGTHVCVFHVYLNNEDEICVVLNAFIRSICYTLNKLNFFYGNNVDECLRKRNVAEQKKKYTEFYQENYDEYNAIVFVLSRSKHNCVMLKTLF